jgi:cyanophycinase
MRTELLRRLPLPAVAFGVGVGLLLLAWLTACAPSLGPAPAAVPKTPGGHLVLVGGGDKPADAMALFVALAGGAEAHLVILPLASGDSRTAGAEYVERFAALGVADVDVIHIDDRRDAARAAYVARVRRASGVWFAGGDQSRIAARLRDTPLHAALRELRARGGVVGGTSAGTACQSAIMLTGEGQWAPGRLELTSGLDLAPGLILDTHFGRRHRQGRLRVAVAEFPDRIGVGVDEGTAVWIAPDGTMTVLGAGAAWVYRAGSPGPVDDTAPSAAPADARGVGEIVVPAGGRYHLGPPPGPLPGGP